MPEQEQVQALFSPLFVSCRIQPMEVVLFEPEIPPNTGNIARLCAVTGTRLHLIEPLGFKLEDRYLKRAGLDYWPFVDMQVWPDMAHFCADWHATRPGARLIITSSKKGGAPAHRFAFMADDILLFGRETAGLPEEVKVLSGLHVRIPMLAGHGRCLNLSTSCGIVLYLALAASGVLDSADWR